MPSRRKFYNLYLVSKEAQIYWVRFNQELYDWIASKFNYNVSPFVFAHSIRLHLIDN